MTSLSAPFSQTKQSFTAAQTLYFLHFAYTKIYHSLHTYFSNIYEAFCFIWYIMIFYFRSITSLKHQANKYFFNISRFYRSLQQVDQNLKPGIRQNLFQTFQTLFHLFFEQSRHNRILILPGFVFHDFSSSKPTKSYFQSKENTAC